MLRAIHELDAKSKKFAIDRRILPKTLILFKLHYIAYNSLKAILVKVLRPESNGMTLSHTIAPKCLSHREEEVYVFNKGEGRQRQCTLDVMVRDCRSVPHFSEHANEAKGTRREEAIAVFP